MPSLALPQLTDLSKCQAKWVELVAMGETDEQAYLKAYSCKTTTAKSSAYRLRKNPKILTALMKVQAAIEAIYLEALAPSTRKGRLCRIMMEGSDSDAIRAIGMLNDMEERERTLGGGQETEFSKLVRLIASKRRVLPFQDEDDKRMIELDPDLPGSR